jgi:hypothetical protein
MDEEVWKKAVNLFASLPREFAEQVLYATRA